MSGETTRNEADRLFPSLPPDFSHDNTMAEILAALEMLKVSSTISRRSEAGAEDAELNSLFSLFKDVADLPTQPRSISPHSFVVSSIVPFSGRFVFERVTCSAASSRFGRDSTWRTRTFVRTLIK